MADPGRRNKTRLEAAEMCRLEDGGNGPAVIINGDGYMEDVNTELYCARDPWTNLRCRS